MIRFRPMEEFDIPYVCDIEQQCFGKRSPEDFEKCIKNPLYYYVVALKGQIVVGYFGIMILNDECEILTIAVDSFYRRQHIGSDMMRFMFKFMNAKKIKTAYLEVNENNVAAIALYTKYGFEKSYTRKNYYGQDSALILKKEFEY